MALLEVKDLSLAIGRYPILRDVDLSVDAGEILGVIGESGSGKSMTALSIMQLLPHGRAGRRARSGSRGARCSGSPTPRCRRSAAAPSAWCSRSR